MSVIDDRLALLDSLVLDEGGHASFDQGHCALEAVAWLAGEPHSDHPECVSPAIAAFVRNWNDNLPGDDRQVLKGFLPRLVGTRRDDDLEDRLGWMAADWLARTCTPAWLRLAGLDGQADRMEGLAELSPDTFPAAKSVLGAVGKDAAAARDAARAAARAAARDAAGAAAGDAAGAAARAAAGAAAWDAARAAARDAAGAALEPTKRHLQLSALGLLEAMVVTAEGWPAEPGAAA